MTAYDTTAGTPRISRAAEDRAVDGIVEDARAGSGTRVLVVAGDAAPMATPDRLQWVTPAEVPAGASWGFLGRDADGAPALVAAFPRSDDVLFPAPAGWSGLRTIASGLDQAQAEVLVEAVTLGRWLREAAFCPRCGTLCEVRSGGWARHCPSCARDHFPRTDPAVIVAVTSAKRPDHLLLGSNALWTADRFSCFAGFVEAGESLEDTVHRELREECGVEVVDVRYRGSQSWPYPRSLMIGFLATAVDDDAAEADGDEIADVRWFSRDEIGAGLRGEGSLLLPGPSSISRRLIRQWHEGAE